MAIGGVIGRVGDSSRVSFFRKVFGFFNIRPSPPGGWLLVSREIVSEDTMCVVMVSRLNANTKL
jgi:hypothetical protein